MKSLLLVSLLTIPACYGGERANTGECPAGEVCSTATPNGLHFIGKALVDDVLVSGPAPTAVGGTQEVALQYDRGDGILIALDLPFAAADDGGIGVKVDHISGSVVTMRGMGSRENYLRITDPATDELYDRKMLTGAKLETIALVPTDFERVPYGMDLAFNHGEVDVGVALWGAVQESGGPTQERLVDTSMALALAGSTQPAWDVVNLASANAGTYPLSITAGDKPAANVDVIVVDGADALVPQDPPPMIPPGGSGTVCFTASSAGRYVVGLSWSFLVDGVNHTQGAGTIQRNCITVSTTKTTGTVSVQVAAGGMQTSVALAIGAMTRELPQGKPHATFRTTTLGDRATM